MSFQTCSLWTNAFTSSKKEPGYDLRKELESSLLKMREQTAFLVGEIASDLKEFTVHDISHLDALWGIASEIAGPDYSINALEAYILGGAILVHDAGMAAASFPGGLEEIKKHPRWPIFVRRHSTDLDVAEYYDEKNTLVDFLRSEHASRAQELPRIEWRSPDGNTRHLIENGSFRQKFSKFIGEVAASHWWGHEKLAEKLDKIVPAPPPFPVTWKIDLLKIASLLRLADAAHLDERRAPGFLWALRSSTLSADSSKHWLFQNRLTQADRRGDAIFFSSTADFSKNDADAWWLAYDSLCMVDKELRLTDSLLADRRDESIRFAARRVASADSPLSMAQNITVDGWLPIDSAIKISRVSELIRKLGGEALYGDNLGAPLRELIQNGIDAVLKRSLIDQSFDLDMAVVTVEIINKEGRFQIKVSDNGIGMSEKVLIGNLLDFGNTNWTLEDEFPIEEFPRSPNLTSIGKFGIGFFSVFMLGNDINIISRRFDKSRESTACLHFKAGLNARPLLSIAELKDRRATGGTEVTITLKDLRLINKIENDISNLHNVICQMFPVSSVRIKVTDGEFENYVDGRKCFEENEIDLLTRINGNGKIPDMLCRLSGHMRPVLNSEGRVVGRALLGPRDYEFDDGYGGRYGVITCKGVASGSMTGIYGFLEGNIITAARDLARPSIDIASLSKWVHEQEILLEKFGLSLDAQISTSCMIRAIGCIPSLLKICYCSEGGLNVSELRNYVSKFDHISVIHASRFENHKNYDESLTLNEGVICADMSYNQVFHGLDGIWRESDFVLKPGLQELVFEIISDSWGLSEEIRKILVDYNSRRKEQKVSFAKNAAGSVKFARGYNLRRNMSEDDILSDS